ncbi:MAG: N-acetylmuramoyl-L-alanine amidase [Spirochaetes bacterium]|nr:N-acetylmuramoyl-L-alanine amidase [Spirochaetota bacterium]MBP8986759.1 N-acetylmuramoyl-L-alanine amidase [Spirochaetota bacterium]HQQ49728.1 N-acetylmuramoyl-L-alanine amidase [Spirochaetota bacterium]
MKKSVLQCILLFCLMIPCAVFAEQDIITTILNEEQSKERADEIIQIVGFIDELYNNLPQRIKNGQKLVLFFDPAHGIDDDGKWEGEKTGRLSCTGLPEEFYSIAISRKLYTLLKKNPYIQVASTKDYIDALEGNSDSYNNITFKETVELARNARAALVISEHLNNTASLFKAYGLVNVKGIHVTYSNNTAYLTHIKEEHKGFLTLYNKFDTSGFSYKLASAVKGKLVANGLRVNSWNFGTVADDRFSYFVNYPISVIFESGFISNPDDETMLCNPDYQQLIAKSHYESILGTIAQTFGVDLSGFWGPKIIDTDFHKNIMLLKLSRIACNYISKNDTSKGLYVLQILLNQCDPEKDKAVIENITDMKYRIERSQTLYAKTLQLKKKGQIRKAKISMRKAISLISRSPVFYEMRKAYRTEYRVLKETPPRKDYAMQHPIPAKVVNPSPSSITTPVLIVLKKDITISEAIYNALRCDDAMLKKLTQQFASSKIKAGKKRFENPTKEGIYIVQLTPKGNIKSVKRVTIVKLNPYKYQNQMYLKNSYCVSKEKSKSL